MFIAHDTFLQFLSVQTQHFTLSSLVSYSVSLFFLFICHWCFHFHLRDWESFLFLPSTHVFIFLLLWLRFHFNANFKAKYFIPKCYMHTYIWTRQNHFSSLTFCSRFSHLAMMVSFFLWINLSFISLMLFSLTAQLFFSDGTLNCFSLLAFKAWLIFDFFCHYFLWVPYLFFSTLGLLFYSVTIFRNMPQSQMKQLFLREPNTIMSFISAKH